MSKKYRIHKLTKKEQEKANVYQNSNCDVYCLVSKKNKPFEDERGTTFFYAIRDNESDKVMENIISATKAAVYFKNYAEDNNIEVKSLKTEEMITGVFKSEKVKGLDDVDIIRIFANDEFYNSEYLDEYKDKINEALSIFKELKKDINTLSNQIHEFCNEKEIDEYEYKDDDEEYGDDFDEEEYDDDEYDEEDEEELDEDY